MKKIKSLFILGLSVLSLGALASCGDNRTPEEHIEDAKAICVYDGLATGVSGNFNLYTELEGCQITYTSSNEDALAISDDGTVAEVIQPDWEDTQAFDDGTFAGYTSSILTATFTYGETTGTKKFNVKINASGAPADIVELRKLTAVPAVTSTTVYGYVVAKSSANFVVWDNTGYIFVYSATDCNVGDYVKVSGTISFYSNAIQLKEASSVVAEKVHGYTFEQRNQTPAVWGKDEIVAWGNIKSDGAKNAWGPQLVQYVGTLSISGSYYNVAVDGVTSADTAVQGSLLAPTQTLENGKKYTFVGYACYGSGTYSETGGFKYMNTVLVSATEVA